MVNDLDDGRQLVTVLAASDENDAANFHLSPDRRNDLGVSHSEIGTSVLYEGKFVADGCGLTMNPGDFASCVPSSCKAETEQRTISAATGLSGQGLGFLSKSWRHDWRHSREISKIQTQLQTPVTRVNGCSGWE